MGGGDGGYSLCDGLNDKFVDVNVVHFDVSCFSLTIKMRNHMRKGALRPYYYYDDDDDHSSLLL